MKPSTRKDGDAGGGGVARPTGASPSITLSCLDMKSFVASLAVLTFMMAMWQLQPYYDSFLSSRSYSSCPLSGANLTVAAAAAATKLPKSHLSPFSPSPSSSSAFPSNSAISATAQLPKDNLSLTLSLSTLPPSNSTPAKNFTTPPTPMAVASSRPGAAPSEPNKRVFRGYGSAAALFVQMGAYRGGPRTFAVVGLASKPTHVFGTPYFKCEWVPSSPGSPPTRTKAYKMLPDWGYGRVYTVVVVNCTFPSNPNADNAGGRLLLHAYYSTASSRYERFMALEEAPGAYDESRFRPPFPYEYLYCGSSLYGNLSAGRMREWMAYHAHFFGPRSHFVFHDAGGVGPAVRAALEPWVRAGRLTIQDVREQGAYDGYYYNQFLVVNDCLHRYRHAANWTFFFDVDEYLQLPQGQHSLQTVLAQLSRYTQFTIEQYPMSSKLCVLDPTRNHSREWGFEKLVFRKSMMEGRRDRKYAIQARNAYSAGVHMSQNLIGRTTHRTEGLIRYYHYHNSINVDEPCCEFVPVPPRGGKTLVEGVPYTYDDSIKHVADQIKLFEKETIGSNQT